MLAAASLGQVRGKPGTVQSMQLTIILDVRWWSSERLIKGTWSVPALTSRPCCMNTILGIAALVTRCKASSWCWFSLGGTVQAEYQPNNAF